MLNYIVRRLVYGALVLLGVNLITFFLFFTVNTPDDMARLNIGGKRVTQELIDKWKSERGYDKPLYYNAAETGADKVTETIFWDRSVSLFSLDFGRADSEAAGDIGDEVVRAHVGEHLARRADLHPAGDRQRLVRAAAGDVPPHAARPLGRGAVRRDAVDLGALLHHRRPVPVRARAAAGAHLRLRRGAGPAALPGAAGAARGAVAPGHRGAPVPRDVPGGDRQGLRPHRARQGAGRAHRDVPPRAAQRDDPDPHQRRRLPAVRVPRQPRVRELLRHPGPRRLRDRSHRQAGFRHRAHDGVRRLGAVHRELRAHRHRLHVGRPAGPARASVP